MRLRNVVGRDFFRVKLLWYFSARRLGLEMLTNVCVEPPLLSTQTRSGAAVPSQSVLLLALERAAEGLLGEVPHPLRLFEEDDPEDLVLPVVAGGTD